jgi:hypothetical protein
MVRLVPSSSESFVRCGTKYYDLWWASRSVTLPKRPKRTERWAAAIYRPRLSEERACSMLGVLVISRRLPEFRAPQVNTTSLRISSAASRHDLPYRAFQDSSGRGRPKRLDAGIGEGFSLGRDCQGIGAFRKRGFFNRRFRFNGRPSITGDILAYPKLALKP